MEMFDSHAHYDDVKFEEDREEVIDAIYNSGVTKFVSSGYNEKSSKEGMDLAKKYSYIYTTCGISPNDVEDTKEKIENQINYIEELLKKELDESKSEQRECKVVGVGEIGLDYYWNKENKELQRYAFVKQIELANKYGLPIVIHTREAVDDTLDIIKNIATPNKKGIFHCCPLNRELIKQALEQGFYISFAGPITFKNSKNAEEIANLVPLDKMLVETDSPYLAPEPKRGTRNDSRNILHTIEKIAEFRGTSPEEIAEHTYKNAVTIYSIK